MNRPLVPRAQFGRDHWSVLVYIETRCVDDGGIPELERLRCNPETHPHNYGRRREQIGPGATRLADGTRLEGYDDWDCLQDLEVEGFIVDIGTGINPQYRMTPYGWETVSKLRQWRADRKPPDEFKPGLPKKDRCSIAGYCHLHNFWHGGEAEELRRRLEALAERIDGVTLEDDDRISEEITKILEEVDARDSTAFLEMKQESGLHDKDWPPPDDEDD